MRRPDRAAVPLALAFGLLGATACGPASAQNAAPGGEAAAASALSVAEPWMRYIIPARPAGGYFRLENTGGEAVAVTGARSPACGTVMLHESRDGVMRHVDRVNAPARGAAVFEPGGHHLMCMKPDMAVGDEVPVTLSLSDGRSVTTVFRVYGAEGKPE